MINYIGKFLLVIFDIKKKPLCEERLLFYVSVSSPKISLHSKEVTNGKDRQQVH